MSPVLKELEYKRSWHEAKLLKFSGSGSILSELRGRHKEKKRLSWGAKCKEKGSVRMSWGRPAAEDPHGALTSEISLLVQPPESQHQDSESSASKVLENTWSLYSPSCSFLQQQGVFELLGPDCYFVTRKLLEGLRQAPAHCLEWLMRLIKSSPQLSPAIFKNIIGFCSMACFK